MENTTPQEKKKIPKAVSRYMSEKGKKGGNSLAEKLKANGTMDAKIRKMTDASLRTRALKKLIREATSTGSL